MDDRDLRRAAAAALLLERQQEEIDQAKRVDSQVHDPAARALAEKVRRATSSTELWLMTYARTFNPRWKEQQLAGPYLPFPDWPFFRPLLEYLEDDSERVKLIEKSRDMMVTWAVTGYFTLQAMLVPEREIVIQTQTDEKAEQVIDYAKALWSSQPQFLKDAFPVPKPVEKQPKNEFRVGSSVMYGIPSGIGKIRSYHPWGYFNDETAFQPDGVEAFDEALAGGCRKLVLNSTAKVSPYWNYLYDIDVDRMEY